MSIVRHPIVERPPLPHEAPAFGTSAVQSYMMRDPWLTYSAGDITAVENAANPGTYDLSSVRPPSFVAAGLEGNDCAEFDATAQEYFVANTLPYLIGDEVDIHMVCQYTETMPPVANSTPYMLYKNGDGASVESIVCIFRSTDIYGLSKTVTGGTQSKTHSLTDLVLASVTNHDGASALRVNGTTHTFTNPTAGMQYDTDRLVIGANNFFAYWKGRVAECVVCLGSSDAEQSAYEDVRIKTVYPTIGALL